MPYPARHRHSPVEGWDGLPSSATSKTRHGNAASICWKCYIPPETSDAYFDVSHITGLKRNIEDELNDGILHVPQGKAICDSRLTGDATATAT